MEPRPIKFPLETLTSLQCELVVDIEGQSENGGGGLVPRRADPELETVTYIGSCRIECSVWHEHIAVREL